MENDAGVGKSENDLQDDVFGAHGAAPGEQDDIGPVEPSFKRARERLSIVANDSKIF